MWQSLDLWKFLAGLGLLLFGMKFLEQSLQALVGRSFKIFLREQTQNLIKSILTGTIATMILQSSSVVMLMVLAFVGAGVLELKHALGIILGSNLGTTFTGWLVTALGFKVSVESFALPLLAVGSLLMLMLQRSAKLKSLGRLVAGFGFLFLGLNYMKVSVEDVALGLDINILKGHALIIYLFSSFLLTALIQSSSAMMVITLSALNAQLIDLPAAAALVIGADLGTTITAILGSLRGTVEKKRVALGHFLFNLVTDVIAFVFLVPILSMIQYTTGVSDPLYSLVLFHSSFNLMGILIFIPFLHAFANFLNRQFLGPKHQGLGPGQGPGHQQLQMELVKVPEAGIVALKKETEEFLKTVVELNLLGIGISQSNDSFWNMENKTFKSKYENLKLVEGDILDFSSALQRESLRKEEILVIQGLIQSVRNAVQSVKAIKDIYHNLKEIENSTVSVIHTISLQFVEFQKEFYKRWKSISELAHNDVIYEEIVSLRDWNKQKADEHSTYIYQNSQNLKELWSSNLLNVNREIYLSSKAVIMSLVELRLESSDVKCFQNLPD